MTFPYLELALAREDVDRVSGWLFLLGAAGVEERAGTLIAYFETPAAARAARRALGRGKVKALTGDAWADAWKKYARARRFGHLVIAPHHKRLRPRRGDRVVRLDPGRAFGTGSHPTTALCLGWIAANVRRGRFLDVGTGSGVLAIAAARLGARRVVAVDTDPEAIATARENAAMNDVRIDLRVGSATDVTGRYDVVAANLTARDLVTISAALRARVATKGTLVASGILAGQVPEVREALAPLSGSLLRRGEWRALVLGRPR